MAQAPSDPERGEEVQQRLVHDLRLLQAGQVARFLLVEEAGHLASLEQPEIVNEALLDFLAPLWV